MQLEFSGDVTITMAFHPDLAAPATSRSRLRPSLGLGDVTGRAMDVVLTLAILVLISPLLLATAIAIAATSRGPVLFKQERIGKDGVPFKMLKFRSMYADAEARRAELLAMSDREGVCFKAKNDPRITPVGRFIRRASIDELPQLFNVLKGDMSLVGPRPALPEEVAAYSPRARMRLATKPGITGLWQVSGRADIGFDRMVEMDIAYCRTKSVALDLMLLVLTIRTVLSGRGAY